MIRFHSRILLAGLALVLGAESASAQVLRREHERSNAYWGWHFAVSGTVLIGGAFAAAAATDSLATYPLSQRIWEAGPNPADFWETENRGDVADGALALALVLPVASLLVANGSSRARNQALFVYGEAIVGGYLVDQLFRLGGVETRAPLAFSAAVAASLLFSEARNAPGWMKVTHGVVEVGLASVDSVFWPQFASQRASSHNLPSGHQFFAGLSGLVLGGAVYGLSYPQKWSFSGARAALEHVLPVVVPSLIGPIQALASPYALAAQASVIPVGESGLGLGVSGRW